MQAMQAQAQQPPQQAQQQQPAEGSSSLAAQLEEARREAAVAHAQAAQARSRGALVEKAWQSALEVRFAAGRGRFAFCCCRVAGLGPDSVACRTGHVRAGPSVLRRWSPGLA